MKPMSRANTNGRRTMWGVCSAGLLLLVLIGATGCGVGPGGGNAGGTTAAAMPLTDEKTREFESLQQAANPNTGAPVMSDGSQTPDDAQQKAKFESMVAKPLEQMGYTFDATVRAALDAEQDNPNFLDPLRLSQSLWYTFVRQPIANRDALLRWGAITQATYDLLTAAATKGQ